MLYAINLFELTSVSNKPVWNHFNPNSTLKYIVNSDYMYMAGYKRTKIAFLDKETAALISKNCTNIVEFFIADCCIFNQHTLLFLCY